MKLSEEDRGTILRGILDSDIYPNEFLEMEIAPTPENNQADAQVDEPIDAEVVDAKVDDEVEKDEEEEQQPEEQVSELKPRLKTEPQNLGKQAVPPAVQDESQADDKPDLDSQEGQTFL